MLNEMEVISEMVLAHSSALTTNKVLVHVYCSVLEYY